MWGGALEASLILMISTEKDAVLAICEPFKKHILSLTLSDLIKVAKDMGWLPYRLDRDCKGKWDEKQAHIGDHAEILRMIRNLIHPGNYIKKYKNKRITKKYSERASLTMQFIHEWLYHHLASSIVEQMENEPEEVE